MDQTLKIKQKISALAGAGNFAEAIALAKPLVQAAPGDIEVWWVLSQLHQRLGEYDQALFCLSRVCQRPSSLYLVAIERSVDLAISNQIWGAALVPARELAKLQKDNAEAQFKLGLVLFFLQRHLAAIEAFERTLEINPNHIDALNRCGMSYGYIGQGRQSLDFYDRSLACERQHNRAQRLRASCFLYLDGLDEADALAAHQQAASALVCSDGPAGKDMFAREANKSLRIGFCSEDFRRHSVASFLLPIFKSAQAKNWELYCYSDVAVEDEVSRHFKSLSHGWRDARGLNDEALCERIRADRIDVLFDLMGYFGQARLGVFAERAAPVQVNYLGYPHTSGLEAMDYRLVDGFTDPGGDPYFTEALFRMPRTFLCYEPAQEAPDVTALPAGDKGYVTFASFNSMQKFSDKMLEHWAKILLRVANARLIIKSIPLGESALSEQLYARFEALGIGRERLELLGMIPSIKDHLALYGQVDIHLDTFPYNGTTTTCEALWQGVPTVTLAGDTHRSRVGCSLLNQVNLGDWVAHSYEEYVDKAVSHAEAIDELNDLRKQLRQRMRESALTDSAGMVNDLEDFFQTALQHAGALTASPKPKGAD